MQQYFKCVQRENKTQLTKKEYKRVKGIQQKIKFNAKLKAPEIFAKNGLEWLFRFVQEPVRLARRYLIDNTLFILFFLKQYFRGSDSFKN